MVTVWRYAADMPPRRAGPPCHPGPGCADRCWPRSRLVEGDDAAPANSMTTVGWSRPRCRCARHLRRGGRRAWPRGVFPECGPGHVLGQLCFQVPTMKRLQAVERREASRPQHGAVANQQIRPRSEKHFCGSSRVPQVPRAQPQLGCGQIGGGRGLPCAQGALPVPPSLRTAGP